MPDRNILLLTTWGYNEGLIQAATLPYLKIIQEANRGIIYLSTEEKETSALAGEYLAEVNAALAAYRIVWKPQPYASLGMKKQISTLTTVGKLALFVMAKKISAIHAFCTPAGVTGYLVSKLTGRRLVMDSFEPHSEYMLESGVWAKESFTYRFLQGMEKKMARHAAHIIATTESMREYAACTYGMKNTADFFVRPTCVDLDAFQYSAARRAAIREQLGCSELITGIYAGKFGGTYLSGETFAFFKAAYDHWKGNFFLILLSPHTEAEIAAYCTQSGFPRRQVFLKNVPHSEVPGYLSAADFALTPVRPTPSKKYCTPIKDGEYWAVGLPVIITKDISDDSDIIEREHGGAVIQELNTAGYVAALLCLDTLIAGTPSGELRQHVRRIAERYRNFDIARQVYRNIYPPQ